MEESLFQHPMLTLTLNPRFHHQQWQLITRQTPQQYHSDMHKIEQFLTQHQLHTQLQHFKRNQQVLRQWHRNAQNEAQWIEPYLFRSQTRQSDRFIGFKRQQRNHLKTQTKSVRKYFAQTTSTAHLQRFQDLQPVDIHELYLDTFVACKGQRYAPYDYDRHMRSSQQRKRYNDYIRVNHKRHFTSSTPKRHKLQHFEQWRKPQSTNSSLVDFRQILGSLNLNCQHGLHSLMQKQGAHKLVLLNHQRKPVNYYLRPKVKLKKQLTSTP